MKALLADIRNKFKVEGFHLLGFSANSAGEFEIGIELASEFSSIIAMPGHPRTNDKEKLLRLKNVKLLFIVGDSDGWWKRKAVEYEKMLNELGIHVSVVVVENGGHILSDYAGLPLFKQLDKLR